MSTHDAGPAAAPAAPGTASGASAGPRAAGAGAGAGAVGGGDAPMRNPNIRPSAPSPCPGGSFSRLKWRSSRAWTMEIALVITR